MVIVFKMVVLTFSICYIVDISGIIQKLNKWCWVRLFGANLQYNGWYIPVIGCSRCLTFWSVLLYSVIISGFDYLLCLGLASLLRYISPIVTLLQKRLIALLSDFLIKRNAI